MLRPTLPLAALCAALVSTGVRLAGAPGPSSPGVDLSAYASVVYVDSQRGNDFTGDGTTAHPWASFEHAFGHLAIPAAGTRAAVLVGAGHYVQPTFALKSRVDIYGGFSTPGGARDVYRYPTVFDGQDSHRIAIGADDARVDGVQFVAGRVRGKGAALLCDGTSPEIADCIFRQNRTVIPAGWNPPHLHETANDGGAIACLDGAKPRLAQNLFFENTTQCGRGAAIACDGRSSPRIEGNVFANNRAGLDDPMRSSDGGAISIFDHSAPEVTGNVIVANQCLAANDSGGVWVALWSSPRLAGNWIVGNQGADDSGGLFVGGQEHRYDQPLDPFPPADRFLVRIERNWFIGNRNASGNSGAMRITMESRAKLSGNVIAENLGGMYLQRSEIVAEHNTVWQDWMFLEDKDDLAPSRFVGDVLAGPAGGVEARVTIRDSMAQASVKGVNDVPVRDIFLADGLAGALTAVRFDAERFVTVLTLEKPLPSGASLAGRALMLGKQRIGQWRVIKQASDRTIELWGKLEPTTKPFQAFEILRSFTPRPDAPAGLGAPAGFPDAAPSS